MMKAMLAVLLFALPAFAQDPGAAALTAAGCGPSDVEFNVKADKKQHPLPQPNAGKATVVVITQIANCIGCSVTKVGIDGAWVGANRGHSYLFSSIEPGDHRVCAAYQSKIKKVAEKAAAASLTAEAGTVYYFQFFPRNNDLVLKPVDPAEGPLLLKSTALSTSEVKKSDTKP
jgi:hypothetical protein